MFFDNSYYVPSVGSYAGQKGKMVGRVSDPSYDDIQLEFPDGNIRWYRYREVVKWEGDNPNTERKSE